MDLLKRFQKAVKKHSLKLYAVDGEFFSISNFLGEAGEYANARKKMTFTKYSDIRKNMDPTKDWQENSIDEAGDTLFYFVQALQKAGITVEEALEHQLTKLNNKSLDLGRTWKK